MLNLNEAKSNTDKCTNVNVMFQTLSGLSQYVYDVENIVRSL